jgi:excisionase family DNA binding protein
VDIVTGFGWDAIWIGSFVFGNASFYHREMTNINKPNQDVHMSALLTMSQIAERWQVSIETVKRRIRSGQLPALKLGRCVRVSPTCLVAYENNRKLKP